MFSSPIQSRYHRHFLKSYFHITLQILQLWHHKLLSWWLSSHCVKSVQIQGFFWSVFSCIWTEYRDLRSKSPDSVQIQKIWTRKNSVFGHFNAVSDRSTSSLSIGSISWKVSIDGFLLEPSSKASKTPVLFHPLSIIYFPFGMLMWF